MLNLSFPIFGKKYQLNEIRTFLLMILWKWVIKTKSCGWSMRIKVNTVLSQQQWWGNGLNLLKGHSDMRKPWWGNDLKLLKAHSDMRKQIEIVDKSSELAYIGLSNFLVIIHIPCSHFLMSGMSIQQHQIIASAWLPQKNSDFYPPSPVTTFSFYNQFS